MAVGGDDDTLASSVPTLHGVAPVPDPNELVSGRYQIVRWLGGGGMGRVYEAFDTELEERVALKVLRSGLSEDALERFRREVKLTRRIQHRNVARMFDIGEHKGEKFLTMELVDGEPLSRRIGDRPMAWPQLKAIAEQLCAGLAAAHVAGVIHRDLKPDNVLLERQTERAVLTDFGIARSGDDPSVTQVGAVVGTPRYMAPEQLAGLELDARADLFSLGVMLFELATGMRPWPGDNAIAIAVSQATSAPRTIDTSSGDIPPSFALTVAACLRTDPRDRPASAAEVGEAIATGTTPASRAAQPTRSARPPRPTGPPDQPVIAAPTLAEPATIAVLPLACAPADEYLADGVVEDLTDTLSTTPGIRVRPSGTVRSATAPDPRDVGHRLGVDHVVVGSLRRTPGGLRMATRLICIADGFQIWAHKTDLSEAEVLDVASALAGGVAAALSSRATCAPKPTDPRAVELYLRARAELRRFWGTHAQTAAGLLEQALDFAPTSTPILGAFAYASVQTWVMRGEPELRPAAERALERALPSGHAEAMLAAAQFHFNCGQLEQGATELGRVLVRAPMSAHTHELAGKILIEIEGPAQARHHYETARGLDPGRTQMIEAELARIDALDGKWDTVDPRIERLVADQDPSIVHLGLILRARMGVWRGRRDVMLSPSTSELQKVTSNASQVFKAISSIQRDGVIDRAVWDRVTRQGPAPGQPVRQHLARLQIFTEIAILLDEHELALDAIGSAAAVGLMDAVWLANCPLMDRIAMHPRFAPLQRDVTERARRVLGALNAASTSSG